MTTLRDAASRLLENFTDDDVHPSAGELQIERVTCDIQDQFSGRGTELVTLRLLDGALQTACTCARVSCPHVRSALQLVAAAPGRTSGRPERLSLELRLPHEPALARLGHARASALCEPLLDVITAVVRAGVASEHSASVLETLSRVERALPAPLPLGLMRWLGRMREALDSEDVALVAQALSAAAALTRDLRADSLDAAAQARVVTWLGGLAASELKRLSDRRMLEVAREWVTGTQRQQIERRYLVDLDSGESFREESVRRESMSSLGPCPRAIGVSLAEVELGFSPCRLRLLQYTTTPEIDGSSWQALAAWGARDTELLATAYRDALRELGALAEPFALIVPERLQGGRIPKLVCERGAPLPLCADDEPGTLRQLEELFHAHGTAAPAWVAGRLLQQAGKLMLRPLAAGIVTPSGLRHERL